MYTCNPLRCTPTRSRILRRWARHIGERGNRLSITAQNAFPAKIHFAQLSCSPVNAVARSFSANATSRVRLPDFNCELSYRCFIGAHYTILTPKCTLEGTNLLSDQAILAKLSRASTMDSIASSASPLPMPARTYSQKAQSPVRL